MKRYTAEEKAQLLKQVAEKRKQGYSLLKAAQELGTNPITLRKWSKNPVKTEVIKLGSVEPKRKYMKKSAAPRPLALFIGSPEELVKVLNGYA